MKKGILVLVLMMALSSVVSAHYSDSVPALDIFNNDVLEIVAEKKNEPSEPTAGAKLIEEYVSADYSADVLGYFLNRVRLYDDGSYTIDRLMESQSHDIEKATRYYPAYLKGNTEGIYVVYEISEEKFGDDYYQDIFLLDTRGQEMVKKLIGAMSYNYETRTYRTFSAKEENGVIVRTPLAEEPISEEEFNIMKKGTLYNDGLKFGNLPDGEGLRGFTDINDKVYYTDYQLSYFGYMYNLGYVVSVSNNGGVLDYSVDDYEKQRVFTTEIENVFTGEIYKFDDVNVYELYDSGYAEVSVKDADRNEKTYIAKVKPAIITVTLNGEKILFDVLPISEGGRTLVPLRAIFEALDAEVAWDGENQIVRATKGTKYVEIKLGSLQMKVGAETKTLDVPAMAIDGRVMVPVRAISEALDCKVDWNNETKTVIIEN